MNQYLKNLIWDECNKANHFLHIPGIYRHFKLTKDEEDMLYVVSNISIPLKPANMLELQKEEHQIYMFYHTELKTNTWIFRVKDKYYHPASIEKEKLVIYTALYGDRQTYVRPLKMFISKVDKEKYPNVNYEYRFQRI